jgi:hypothetical protein
MPQYALFIMPLISILLGVLTAFIAHHLASKRFRNKELLSFQLIAYSDFINAISEISVIRRQGNIENSPEMLAKLNDAKTRIIVCGEDDVVRNLEIFWDTNATLELEDGLLTFNQLLTSMRTSLGNKKLGANSYNITNTLFKLESSQYSYKVEKNTRSELS